jgi:hypothetical protein
MNFGELDPVETLAEWFNLATKTLRKKTLGRPRHRWESSIKMGSYGNRVSRCVVS